jgi:SAM-dependent methyltransferase
MFSRGLRRGVALMRAATGGRPPVGTVRFGDLRRTRPISESYGFDRGLPVDRYYIEKFLDHHRQDVRGRVLEFGDDTYARRFRADGADAGSVEVFDIDRGNDRATLVGDLAGQNELAADEFDCIICTQTLQLIYELPAAVAALHRSLRPGGVALVTAPGLSPIPGADRERWGWHWGLTGDSARRLFGDVFGSEFVSVEAHGNVLSAIAFLHGLAAEELTRAELEENAPEYELLVGIRAVKEP